MPPAASALLGGGEQLLLTGVSGAVGTLTLKGAAFFGIVILILWCIQVKISSNDQKPGLKGSVCMGKLIVVSGVTFLANALTALYVNNLPAPSIRVA